MDFGEGASSLGGREFIPVGAGPNDMDFGEGASSLGGREFIPMGVEPNDMVFGEGAPSLREPFPGAGNAFMGAGRGWEPNILYAFDFFVRFIFAGSGVPGSTTGVELENHLFQKAPPRERLDRGIYITSTDINSHLNKIRDSILEMFTQPMLKKTKRSPIMDEDPFEKIKSLMGKNDIELENNHIYFYADVDEDSCLDLNRKINQLNKTLLKHAIEYDCEPPNIYLHISSYGGCLFSAFSVVDTIKNSRVPIVSIVEGKAASAATIISMACHKRYMTENSFMLIHQLSSMSMGKYEALKDDFLNDTKLMELIYKLYKEHTRLSDKEIKKCLQRDIWWDKTECLEAGLVDALWETPPASLKVDHLFKPVAFDTASHEVERPSKKRKSLK